MQSTRERLASLERQTARLEREQSLLTQQLSATRRTMSVSQRALGLDLRSLYKRGDVSTLAVVLGARSLDDAVSELDALSRAADESHQILGATSAASVRIARLRSSLAARKERLAGATAAGRTGATATGMPVGWGVVAVDPGLIPLGTRLTIPGYGEAVAADTGSGVRGGMIDLWFPTLGEARAWGRRTVTITLH